MISLAFRSLSGFSRMLAALHLCTSTAPHRSLRRGCLIEWKGGFVTLFRRKELARAILGNSTPKFGRAHSLRPCCALPMA
jgi:hypothetical protein